MQSTPRAPHHRRTRTMSNASTRSIPGKICTELPQPIPSSLARLSGQAAYGAFTPTSAASPSLLSLFHSEPESPIGQVDDVLHHPRRRVLSSFHARASRHWSESVPGSPTLSSSNSSMAEVSLPSFSRTSSISSASSVLGAPVPFPTAGSRGSNAGLNPILAELERKSKFCMAEMSCAACHKRGAQFPRCSKCSLTFCSRLCRLETSKHSCAMKRAR